MTVAGDTLSSINSKPADVANRALTRLSDAKQRALAACLYNGGVLYKRNGWWRGKTGLELISGVTVGDLERDGFLTRDKTTATFTPQGGGVALGMKSAVVPASLPSPTQGGET